MIVIKSKKRMVICSPPRCHLDNHKSEACPLDEKCNQALQNFRDDNGVRLSCFVLPNDSTIPGLSFVCDRNYASPEMARHVLITPEDKEFYI